MSTKKVVIGVLGVVFVWGGWLVYRNNRNNKIDSTPISYQDALKKLQKV